MAKTFYQRDGLRPADFLHYAVDHLTAAEHLFKSNASHYDSAGYLAHMGVELALKGWLLHQDGQFEGIHTLSHLHRQLEAGTAKVPLNQEHRRTLRALDAFETLRYPDRSKPVEIGDEDWPRIERLVGHLFRLMPSKLSEDLGAIIPGSKGGRVLMQRRKKRAKRT